jgi:hypothetical protein
MITPQQNRRPQIRDHNLGGFRRERLLSNADREIGVPGKDPSDPRKRGTPNEGVRNEANFQTATGAGGNRRDRRRSRRWARLYKQTQFAGMDRGGRGTAKSPVELSLGCIAPNEPNLPRIGRKRRCPARPGALPTLGAIASNKANSRPGKDGRRPARSPRPLPLGQNVRNEPNLPRTDRKAGAGRAATAGNKRAKQTQFLPSDMEGKYFTGKELWQIGPARGLGKTKPIATRTAVGKGRHSGPCRRWDPACETKPIRPRRSKRHRLAGSGAPPPGTSAPNEANFRSSGRRDAPGNRHRRPATRLERPVQRVSRASRPWEGRARACPEQSRRDGPATGPPTRKNAFGNPTHGQDAHATVNR